MIRPRACSLLAQAGRVDFACGRTFRVDVLRGGDRKITIDGRVYRFRERDCPGGPALVERLLVECVELVSRLRERQGVTRSAGRKPKPSPRESWLRKTGQGGKW
jgi:hypothetical protein